MVSIVEFDYNSSRSNCVDVCCVGLGIFVFFLQIYVSRTNFSATIFLPIHIHPDAIFFMYVDVVALLTVVLFFPLRRTDASCWQCKSVGQHFIKLSKPKYNVSWLILNCIQVKHTIQKHSPCSLFFWLIFMLWICACFLHMFVCLFVYLVWLVSEYR